MQLDSPCIEWTGTRHVTGYGRVCRNGGSVGAHRVAYEDAYGPIPAGMQVRHKCDNPPCVNPEHLVIGTHAENARDRITHRRNGRLCTPQAFDAALIFAADALRAELELGHVAFAFEYIGITDGMWSMLRRGKYSAGPETARKLAAVLRLHKRTVPEHRYLGITHHVIHLPASRAAAWQGGMRRDRRVNTRSEPISSGAAHPADGTR